jgi:hypothetical protein
MAFLRRKSVGHMSLYTPNLIWSSETYIARVITKRLAHLLGADRARYLQKCSGFKEKIFYLINIIPVKLSASLSWAGK